MGVILTVCHWWIVGLWVVFVIYWAIAALRMKRLDRGAIRSGMAMRFGIFATVAIAIALVRRSPELRALQLAQFQSVPMAIFGAIIATLGVVLAFSARAAIGGNWAPPAIRRTDTELVTSGAYALVRHPIYGGILLMMMGTAIGIIPTWWLVAAAAGTYFFYSARAEERFMTERFPDTYPAYRARTKMLLPFVL
jgi:protein-S-isoprenylcysteine O-methyltransferase Ste14